LFKRRALAKLSMSDDSLDRPLLVFDGDCPFCRAWVDYWKCLTGDRVHYAPYQEVAPQFPDVSREEFASAAKCILPGGEVRSGAHAVFSVLGYVPGKRWMLWCYERVPLFAPVSEAAYGVFARQRLLFFRVTKLLWGVPVRPSTYTTASWLFLRLLAAVYLIAFASFGVQAAGLIGSRGILPAADFLAAARQYFGTARFWNVPTLFWISSSDLSIRAAWIGGIGLSVVLLLGLNLRIIRLALFVLYLSLVTAGQVFMGYQWDALLLEAGFLSIFLGASPAIPRLFRWLLCRFMFLSGAVKLASGDSSWRNFTALPVHYETQPLPTPLAWYVYQQPDWFHHVSLGLLFFVELAVPFLVLAPRRLRLFAAGAISLLQLLIFLTGNYAFFNLLTAALCIFLLDDASLARAGQAVRRLSTPFQQRAGPRLRKAFFGVFAALVLLISGFEMAEMFSQVRWGPADALIRAAAPFEIINTYGLFANMTTSRPEIIVEGSADGMTWLPYEFKYKAGDAKRRPPWVEPHQPRLDWQMWFAALGNYRTDRWILYFMGRLLEGSPDVVHLLAKNPFPDAPPRYIRALVYEYRFTTRDQKRMTGDWWRRELKGVYLEPITLKARD
jgi:predicted DCC family thiol-disulfide oxidoreductase YuxK